MTTVREAGKAGIMCAIAALVCADANGEHIAFPENLPDYANIRTEYGAKGDGVTDDTKAIIDAFVGGNKIVYFPEGVYLVTRQVTREKGPGSAPMFIGEDRDKVIIRLEDGAEGFQEPNNPKAVIRTCPQKVHSADHFGRYIRNMTIDAGNNPGAKGIDFYSNNLGQLTDVTIRGNGVVGLDLAHYLNGPFLVKDVLVEGFATGARTGGSVVNSMTICDLTVKNQRRVGLELKGKPCPVLNLKSVNSVPAVIVDGCYTALVNAELTGGSEAESAIEYNKGTLFLRNVQSEGYARVLGGETTIDGKFIDEFCTAQTRSLFAGSGETSLNLPIEPVPSAPFDPNPANWVNVSDYGASSAKGSDTQAYQDAIDAAAAAGKTTVFAPGDYFHVMDGPVRIHGSVRHIFSAYTRIVDGEKPGRFIVEDGPDPVVVIEGFKMGNPWQNFAVENASNRTVVLNYASFSKIVCSGTGRTFAKDIVCRSTEITNPKHRYWAYKLNSECNDFVNFDNRGGTAWILGYKTERRQTKLRTTMGGRSEVIGGLVYQTKKETPDNPLVEIVDASVSVHAIQQVCFTGAWYPVTVRETRNGETRILKKEDTKSIRNFIGYSDAETRAHYASVITSSDEEPPRFSALSTRMVIGPRAVSFAHNGTKNIVNLLGRAIDMRYPVPIANCLVVEIRRETSLSIPEGHAQ